MNLISLSKHLFLVIGLLIPLFSCGGGGGSNVGGGGTGSGDAEVTLEWIAPTENTDGTTLTDLAGYRIYYSSDENVLIDYEEVDDPNATQFVVSNLEKDSTYYFAMTAVNDSNVQSSYSNIVAKIAQ